MNKRTERHWRKRWVIALVAVIVLVNMLALAVGVYIQQVATRWPTLATGRTYAEIWGVSDEELARGFDSERFSRLVQERVQLRPATDAEIINVLLVHAPGVSRGTVVVGGYPYTFMQIGDIFIDRGFNVLFYVAPKPKTSFGYHEKHDLAEVVEFAREKDPQGLIGIYGMSAGGAAAVQFAAMKEPSESVAFYIIDASFSDLTDVISWTFQGTVGVQTPWLVNAYATLVSYLRDGYFFEDVSPRQLIVDLQTPMLFVHGRADTSIPDWMTEELYNAKPGAKLILTHDGGHGLVDVRGGGSIVTNREAFAQSVDALLVLVAEGSG